MLRHAGVRGRNSPRNRVAVLVGAYTQPIHTSREGFHLASPHTGQLLLLANLTDLLVILTTTALIVNQCVFFIHFLTSLFCLLRINCVLPLSLFYLKKCDF